MLAVALAALAPAATLAAEGDVSITGAWMREIIPSRPAAGYFTLHNTSNTPKLLTGAASPACGALMLHRSLHDSGEERMAMVQSVPVPTHGSLAFAPGGYHLMCMKPAASMRPGTAVPVTLHFSDGATLTANFAVKGASGQ